MKPRIAIVGSGEAGLVCALELLGRADVTIVERLPVLGGDDWAREPVKSLVRSVSARSDVDGRCASLAMRWDGERLLSVAPTGARIDHLDALVIATGHRPATRAERGLGGPRPGGILPGTVALHLLQQRLLLGRIPAVIGTTRLAEAVIELLDSDKRVRRVLQLDPASPTLGDEAGLRYQAGLDWRLTRIVGYPRLTGVEAATESGHAQTVMCDALILADRLIPMRNVDGATRPSARVVYAQSTVESEWDASTCGRAAATRALACIAQPGDVVFTSPRPAPPSHEKTTKNGVNHEGKLPSGTVPLHP
jgi:hypothetical protein